jgi:hypothetical protein
VTRGACSRPWRRFGALGLLLTIAASSVEVLWSEALLAQAERTEGVDALEAPRGASFAARSHEVTLPADEDDHDADCSCLCACSCAHAAATVPQPLLARGSEVLPEYCPVRSVLEPSSPSPDPLHRPPVA